MPDPLAKGVIPAQVVESLADACDSLAIDSSALRGRYITSSPMAMPECRECGVLVPSKPAHDRFHDRLDRIEFAGTALDPMEEG